jgi:hypothetical protein
MTFVLNNANDQILDLYPAHDYLPGIGVAYVFPPIQIRQHTFGVHCCVSATCTQSAKIASYIGA